MVAMGGGPEAPLRNGAKSRDLLLAVLPWPEKAAEKSIVAIKEEFPNLDVHYIPETYSEKHEKRGKVSVPEGKSPSNNQQAPLLSMCVTCTTNRPFSFSSSHVYVFLFAGHVSYLEPQNSRNGPT